VVLSQGLHPEYVQTVETFIRNIDDGKPQMDVAPVAADGRTDLAALEAAMRDDTAAIVVGHPNFFGAVEDLAALRALATRRGALLVTATWEPYAMSVLTPPGAAGADIAIGEGQALAIGPQLGGPGVGLFATKKAYVQKMPGRLCGETTDQNGERGYVLTLSTREQHIRRERATSNICTNHGLVALAFTIRTAMLGQKGYLETGKACLAKSEHLKKRIAASGKFSLPHSAPTFNEFVVRRNEGGAAPLLAALAAKGILGGVPLGRFFSGRDRDFLVAVTERHSREDLDRFADALASV
jgi:glycine dehydrogenase subunit 1